MKTIKKNKKLPLTQAALRRKAINAGVKFIAEQTVFISEDTKFGKNVVIEPYVVIASKVSIGNNVTIKSFSHLEGSKIGNNVVIGPYARLRPGTKINNDVKIGNFVEVKNSKIDKNSKVNHLSYIGDATIGNSTNIGAGTITCNYDGRKKFKTKIGNKVFVGSNSSLVAPLKIDSNAVIGAGSTITKNVKKNALALERNAQVEIKNYKRKK